ncbi:MAG TPA: hypothetical protein VMI73_30160 [Trebonia sp.]|nr:hypothetical protein [Trebonia sp.]
MAISDWLTHEAAPALQLAEGAAEPAACPPAEAEDAADPEDADPEERVPRVR